VAECSNLAGAIADGGKRENLAAAAEGEGGFGILSAVRAKIAWREDLAITVRANSMTRFIIGVVPPLERRDIIEHIS